MFGKGKSAGTSDDRMQIMLAQLVICFFQQMRQCFLNVGIVTLVIRKQKILFFIQNSNLYGGGTDIDSKTVCCFVHRIILLTEFLYNNYGFPTNGTVYPAENDFPIYVRSLYGVTYI